MTNEEAQELIAEINNYHKEICPYECDACRPRYEEIEKIITRFANKPPACGLDVPVISNGEFLANMNLKLNDNRVDITIRNTCTTHSNFISFEKEELKLLRDNITKMLDYLENV